MSVQIFVMYNVLHVHSEGIVGAPCMCAFEHFSTLDGAYLALLSYIKGARAQIYTLSLSMPYTASVLLSIPST